MTYRSILAAAAVFPLASAILSDPYANVSTPLRETMRGKHTGVEINVQVLDFTTSFFSEKIRNYEILTGAKVNTIIMSQQTWYPDLVEDIKFQNPGRVDLYGCFGNWIPQFAELGGFKDITDETLNVPGLDWFDIMPAVRKGVATYKKKVYGVPLDGDAIYMLYRKDLVEDVGLPTPRSWDDVLEILNFYEGKDINGDGIADFGNCFSTAERDIGGTMFWSIASSFLQTLGTAQGVFFNPETMDPVSSTPEFLGVLEIYQKLVQHSPFALNNKGVNWETNRDYFNNKRCVLFYNYPGPIKSIISNQEVNMMNGTLNLAPLPGRKCKEDEFCPFKSEFGVNHAPFLAGGGFAYAVNDRKPPIIQQAALDFALYLSDPGTSFWDVAHPESFCDPLRLRHTASLSNEESLEAKAFLEFGWETRQLKMIKETTEFSFMNDNYVFDLRNLGSNEYQDGGTVPYLTQMWLGNANAVETASNITKAWNSITAQYGLDEQRAFYRNVLGLAEYISPTTNDASNTVAVVLGVTIPFAILALILTFVVLKQRHTIKYHTRDVNNAPTTGTIALIFTDVEGSTKLWDLNKGVMQKALEIHHDVIRSCIDHYSAYEVKTVGDAFMIAVDSADKAVLLANSIQMALLYAQWPLELASMPGACVAYFTSPSMTTHNARRKNSISPPNLMFSGLRVRIGIHLGYHSLRDKKSIEDGDGNAEVQVMYDNITKGYDYYGQVVNAASRIEDSGFGGQTLISQEVYDAISDEVKVKSSISKIGPLNLRGVQKEMTVYSCIPLELNGRKFQGVYRSRSSVNSVGVQSIRMAELESMDVMSMTPVELQRNLLKMIEVATSLKSELDEYKMMKGDIEGISFDDEDDEDIESIIELNNNPTNLLEEEKMINGAVFIDETKTLIVEPSRDTIVNA